MLFQAAGSANMTRDWQDDSGRFMLWIDGVGAWLLCCGDRVTVGGPSLRSRPADICLMAGLSRRHVEIVCFENEWYLERRGATELNGAPVSETVLLSDNDQLRLGDSVQLAFRQPSVLSASAVIEFVSSHRPAQTVDGVVLIRENCLLGAGQENHIMCPDWPQAVVLFVREGRLWCRSRTPLSVDGQRVHEAGQLHPGALVTSDKLRFRVEPV